jgi:3-phosphoshikimate 1-carboxyvinyltransferase
MPVRTSSPATPLDGDVRVPGDGTLSRLLPLLGAVAVGETVVRGLEPGPRSARACAAAEAVGTSLAPDGDAIVRIGGAGLGTLAEPTGAIDVGSDALLAHLIAGLAATHPITVILTGTVTATFAPLITALSGMGASIDARADGRLPLRIVGADRPVPIEHRPGHEADRPGADTVATAVVLAGLNAPGETRVSFVGDPAPLAMLLGRFGASVAVTTEADGTRTVAVTGERRLKATAVDVPGDIGLATAAAVAALVVRGSSVALRDVGLAPEGTAALDLLGEMGAEIEIVRRREGATGTVADLLVRADARLSGLFVPAETTAALGATLALIAVAGAFADGAVVLHGYGAAGGIPPAAMAAALTACGARAEAEGDDLVIHGGAPAGGAVVDAGGDPATALAFLILGAGAAAPVTVRNDGGLDKEDGGAIALLNAIGTRIGEPGPAR